MRPAKYTGVFIALLIITCWLVSLAFLLRTDISSTIWLVLPAILFQTHLYTGLFITAHDAMHRTVSPNRTINNSIGSLCTALYAAFPFKKLNSKHHEHHKHVHTVNDPDFYEGKFLRWYFKFIKEYISIWQVVFLAIVFNVLKLWFEEKNIFLFWVLPSLLSTLQLFYFGTWLPHHGEHQNKHYSASQKKNHFLAFISCYFFGYHYEHHDSPGTPWWRLWKLKE
ncbi:fatty acid desaturase [Desertivirga arenae]|uniref:fatty acid desaturase n=1 Tax=Desertivirga arenae TaxID=2810309 RepID=UPI001A975791|nr:fatty acid desaturase [Pedobacter sp. SYSU D00823]